MATQRPQTSRPTVLTRSDVVRSRRGSLASVPETPYAKPDESPVSPGDRLAKQELMRNVFEKESNKVFKVPDGYQRVEVLILRWDESIDDFEGHSAEIDRLKNIFSGGYGYNCTVAQIDNRRHPQAALNIEILNHILHYDSEGTLLIVYYTGHGHQNIKGADSRLELSASECLEHREGRHIAKAFWDKAEEPLRTIASCDVLVILDCCYASTAAIKGRNEKSRTYMLLAASSVDGLTEEPGKTSFTQALCDSLDELLHELRGATFPLTELVERINKKRPSQGALLWDRLKHYSTRTLSLGRVQISPEIQAFVQENLEKASLELRLSLKVSELNNEEIRTLARNLSAACKNTGIPLRKMEWMELKKRDTVGTLRRAVNAFKRPIRTRSTPGRPLQAVNSAVGQQRAQSDAALHPYHVNSPISQAETMYCEPFNATSAAEGLEIKGPSLKEVSTLAAEAHPLPFLAVTITLSLGITALVAYKQAGFSRVIGHLWEASW